MRAFIIVLSVLTVIMLIPVGIDGGYTGGRIFLSAKAGIFNIRILPQRRKKRKIQTKKPKAAKKNEPETEQPYRRKPTAGLIKTALKTLSRLKRKLRINFLRIHYTVASDDPFKTAMGFGVSSSAAGALIPLIDDAFIVEEKDIGTSFNFLGGKSVFDCWVTMSVHVWEIVYVAAAFGIDYLLLKNRSKREYRRRKE
ncbi:MAG: hypothetical protein GX488_09685 [Clostridiales bacterium]|nr:hypothetical protein [Clostridiales bacterium]